MDIFKQARNNYGWANQDGKWILYFGEVIIGVVSYNNLVEKGNDDVYLMRFMLPYHRHIHNRVIGNLNGMRRFKAEDEAKNVLLNCALQWFQLALKKV